MALYRVIRADVPFAQAEQVYEELVRRVAFDVPEEYELDLDHFREHFVAYCESLGVTPDK